VPDGRPLPASARPNAGPDRRQELPRQDFEAALATLDASIQRLRRKDERGRGRHLLRQRIESIFQTCKDIFTLDCHGARTLANLRVRLVARFAALAAAVALNHRLGRPSRSVVCYTDNPVALPTRGVCRC
jgi:hypothetical protein